MTQFVNAGGRLVQTTIIEDRFQLFVVNYNFKIKNTSFLHKSSVSVVRDLKN